MRLHELNSKKGSKKERKRIGRGTSSGHGKTSGRGHKGQNARSGGGVRLGFEGGQMPLQRRIPKRGFNNSLAKKVAIVNINSLDLFKDGSTVNIESLQKLRLINGRFDFVKILGYGEINKKLTVKVSNFSKSAKEKIEAAGGKAEVV